mgnify:CR=1 FL=1
MKLLNRIAIKFSIIFVALVFIFSGCGNKGPLQPPKEETSYLNHNV